MHTTQISKAHIQLANGIESVCYKSITQEIFTTNADLPPTSLSDKPQLASLYPMKSYEDFIIERLSQNFENYNFLRAENFRSRLTTLKLEIRMLAKRRHKSSKRFGRLAQLLDDQDDLNRLAQIYFSALLQG